MCFTAGECDIRGVIQHAFIHCPECLLVRLFGRRYCIWRPREIRTAFGLKLRIPTKKDIPRHEEQQKQQQKHHRADLMSETAAPAVIPVKRPKHVRRVMERAEAV